VKLSQIQEAKSPIALEKTGDNDDSHKKIVTEGNEESLNRDQDNSNKIGSPESKFKQMSTTLGFGGLMHRTKGATAFELDFELSDDRSRLPEIQKGLQFRRTGSMKDIELDQFHKVQHYERDHMKHGGFTTRHTQTIKPYEANFARF
jgi:hypothetical protein